MFKPDPAGIQFRPFWFLPGLWIVPGLSRRHTRTMILASFCTISMAAFMSFVQPYLLTEVLRIPAESQGRLSGQLQAMQELVIISLAGFAGAWSDRLGRRFVFVTGLLMLSAGYLIYPLASTEAELYTYRLVFAVGVTLAPIMLSACVVDTIQEVSRGRWVGFNNLFQGLGVVFMAAVLARTPAWYAQAGADPALAGRLAYWTAAIFAALAALSLRWGLDPLRPRRPQGGSMLRNLAGAVASIRANRRLLLTYGAAFIGRGDFAVVGVFFSLWIVQYGTEQGMSAGAALARAGIMFGVIQGSAMLWAFCMGMIADRVSRVTGLAIALALAAAGYTLMGEVRDPFAPGLIPIAVLLGMGEVSVIVAGGALFGQEVPQTNRGAAVGLFNLVGGIGILFATYVGGFLFDGLGRTAPFTMMGLLNAALLAVVLLERWRGGPVRDAVA